MKKVLFIFAGLILTINLFAQNCKLSPEANRYWIRATTAMNTITSDDDYKIAAEEFEKALQYAPQCGDILFNLALVYSQIGTKEGDFYFAKAENYLETYKQLNPNDKEADKLAIEIEFKREKFQRDQIAKQQQAREEKAKSLVGTWSTELGYFPITINMDEQGRLWSKVVVNQYFQDHKWYENGRYHSQYILSSKEEKIFYWNTDTEPVSLTFTSIEHFPNPDRDGTNKMSYVFYGNDRIEYSWYRPAHYGPEGLDIVQIDEKMTLYKK